MQITFTPMRCDAALVLSRQGDTLVINGVPYDFAPLPEGALLPRAAVGCDWLASDVEREGGVLRLTLILPHGACAPRDTLFPAPLRLDRDGPVTLPAPMLPDTEMADTEMANTEMPAKAGLAGAGLAGEKLVGEGLVGAMASEAAADLRVSSPDTPLATKEV